MTYCGRGKELGKKWRGILVPFSTQPVTLSRIIFFPVFVSTEYEISLHPNLQSDICEGDKVVGADDCPAEQVTSILSNPASFSTSFFSPESTVSTKLRYIM